MSILGHAGCGVCARSSWDKNGSSMRVRGLSHPYCRHSLNGYSLQCVMKTSIPGILTNMDQATRGQRCCHSSDPAGQVTSSHREEVHGALDNVVGTVSGTDMEESSYLAGRELCNEDVSLLDHNESMLSSSSTTGSGSLDSSAASTNDSSMANGTTVTNGRGVTMTSISEAKVQLKFLIPNALSGCIIGKQGSNLDRIWSSTGAFIQANAPGYAVASRKERFIIVASDSMERCLQGVIMMMRSIEAANKTDLLGNSGDGRLYLKQVIPGACAGSLIGIRGYNLGRISEENKISVIVEPKPRNAGIVPFRIVSYAGSTVDELILGLQAVVNSLRGDDRYSEEIKAIKSVVLKVVEIPGSRVGAFIGPKGLHVQALQQVLRCKLVVSKSSTEDNVYYLTIWGQPENVRAALNIAFLHKGRIVKKSQ